VLDRAELEHLYVLEGELDLLAFQPTAQAGGDWRTWEQVTPLMNRPPGK
jgi:hypothetical protein